MASTYLTRTFGTPTNSYKGTISFWYKKSEPVVSGGNQGLFGACDLGVTANTYAYPASVAVNATGHITSITAGSAPGTMSSFTLAGDTGTNQTITNSDTLTIAGSTGIDTVASATDTITVNLDLAELTTVTTIAPATDYLVGVGGTANEKILYQNVHLNQWGAAEGDISLGSNKITNLANGILSNDAVNFGQLQSAVAGVGLFKGGYNASTNSPAIAGASNIAILERK